LGLQCPLQLYTLSDNPYFLVSVQILDGIAGGIFGVLSVLMVADLTKGTGRFNITQGALNTAVGIGAGLSNMLAGFVVQKAGYNVAFVGLAAIARKGLAPCWSIAAVATIIFWMFVPETKVSHKARALVSSHS
jgi:MFS family permease